MRPAAFIGERRQIEGDDNHFVFRGDYNLSSNDRLSGRYTRGRPFRNQPSAQPANRQSYTYAADSANLSWVHSAPGWTSETRAGLNYTDAKRLQEAFTAGSSWHQCSGRELFYWGRVSDADWPHLQHRRNRQQAHRAAYDQVWGQLFCSGPWPLRRRDSSFHLPKPCRVPRQHAQPGSVYFRSSAFLRQDLEHGGFRPG